MRKSIAALLVATMAAGCSTINQFNNDKSPQAFGGVRNHIEDFPFGHIATELIGSTSSRISTKVVITLLLTPLCPVDFLLSFAYDTVLLPITVPAEMNYVEPEPEE